jgi:hypothetical protein
MTQSSNSVTINSIETGKLMLSRTKHAEKDGVQPFATEHLNICLITGRPATPNLNPEQVR